MENSQVIGIQQDAESKGNATTPKWRIDERRKERVLSILIRNAERKNRAKQSNKEVNDLKVEA